MGKWETIPSGTGREDETNGEYYGKQIKVPLLLFTPTQHKSMTTLTAAKETTLSEPTKESSMCPVDCILRGTGPRKYFTDIWYQELTGTLATGNLTTSGCPEQGLKSTFVPKTAGIRSKEHEEGVPIIKPRKFNAYYSTWANTALGILKNENNIQICFLRLNILYLITTRGSQSKYFRQYKKAQSLALLRVYLFPV